MQDNNLLSISKPNDMGKEMNKKNNRYIPMYSHTEIEKVRQKLEPQNNRACNNNILFSAGCTSYSGNYYGHSLKRSNLSNCTFNEAIFDHTSFCGSILNNITFNSNCKFDSVYLEQSILTNVLFGNGLKITNANFSNSQIKRMMIDSSEIRSVYFDNCHLDECYFNNCTIRATMFDGAMLSNCSLINCNMRNLNIEFVTMDKCDLSGTTISYFQFPYIIGIFKETNNIAEAYVGIHKTLKIPITEYLNNIEDALIYFTGLEEYFPLANLYYSKGDFKAAYNCIMVGIDKALCNLDIRMIENFCKLGQVYDLLTIKDINEILKIVDKKIESERQNPMYDLLISKSYKLKASANQNNNKAKLEIVISTKIDGNRFDLVGDICNKIDNIISKTIPNKINTTYQLSHNSPFEIVLTCVGITADLIAIAGPIYHFISKKMKKNIELTPDLQEYIKNSNSMYLDSLNNQFDLFEQALKDKKKSEYDELIKEFRGKILTTATEQINKDYALLVSQYSE